VVMSLSPNKQFLVGRALLQTLVRYPVGWMSQGARNEKRFPAAEQAADGAEANRGFFRRGREP
jgi:hypothetical protein